MLAFGISLLVSLLAFVRTHATPRAPAGCEVAAAVVTAAMEKAAAKTDKYNAAVDKAAAVAADVAAGKAKKKSKPMSAKKQQYVHVVGAALYCHHYRIGTPSTICRLPSAVCRLPSTIYCFRLQSVFNIVTA